MSLRQLAAIVELRTKVVSISTFVLGLLYALWRGARPSLPIILLGFAATLLVDMGTTAFNSFFDWWRGTDRAETNREADKVIIHEGAPAYIALLLGLGLYAGAAVLGLILAFISGPWVVLAGGLSLLAGFLYSGGPWPLSHSPLGELVAGGFLGSLLFLIVARLCGLSWGGETFLASLPLACPIAAILGVNNACDRDQDRQAGRKTLAVLAGPGAARASILAWLGLGFLGAGGLVLAHNLPWTVAAGLGLALIPALFQLRSMLKRGFSSSTKSVNMGSIVKILLAWSLGLGSGLGMGLYLGL